MKRLALKFALLTVLLLAFALPILTACGDDNTVKEGDFIYHDGKDGTYTLIGTKYDKKGEHKWPDTLEVPGEVDGNVVDGIFDAFNGCYAKKIVLPETITFINDCFNDCYVLEELNIPDAATRIIGKSFTNCPNLVESENGFDYVGKWAVGSDPSAVLATLRPGTIGSIDGVSLMGLMVEGEIVLPDDFYHIGGRAFFDQWGVPADYIKSITVNEILSSESGFARDSRDKRTVVDRVIVKKSLKGGLLYGAKSIGEMVVHGDTMGGGYAANRLVISGGAVPAQYSIALGGTELVINAEVTSVGGNSFISKTLKKVTVFGDTSIAQNAFAKCENIEEIYGPASLLLGMDTGSIKTLTITSGEVSAALLSGARSLESLTLLPGVVVEGNAFAGLTALHTVSVPASALNALPGDRIKHLTLVSTTVLSENAFVGFTALESITLPSGLLSVGTDAFLDLTSLKDVYYGGTVADWAKIRFANGAANPLSVAENLYVGGALITEVLDLSALSPYAFYGYGKLTAVGLLPSVTVIPEGAFYGCVGLTSLSIPASVTRMDHNAFGGCASLTEVRFAETAGWWRYESATAQSGSMIYENYLSTSDSAARYLTVTYANYIWKRVAV
ncbi:MAG: leucine-rich repeat protein [Clostridia bacterium]|nr:leucine-rich repeat protein [Clostridia bacterium]